MSPITAGFYYFGCWNNNTGHYLFLEQGRRVDYLSTPFGYDLDGRVQPEQADGNYCRGYGLPNIRLVHRDGWTAIGFWDNTVDKRPGSCGAFVSVGTKTLDAMLTEAANVFPEIWARLHGHANAGSA